jgi:tricorn protease
VEPRLALGSLREAAPTLYRAIFAYNVETGETRQMTDGLADATWPAWDASGKYLWFLASTNFALSSQWLDMTSYDRTPTRALYMAVLAKGEPSPLLPESDEEAALAGAPPREPGSPERADSTAARIDTARRRPDSTRTPSASAGRMRIDFDGLARRIIAVPGVAVRDYAQLRAGAPGTVFFVETVPAAGTADAPPAAGGVLHRFQLKERKAVLFTSNVAQYVVSADGRKLLYRTPAVQAAPGAPPAGGASANTGSALYLVDADKASPAVAAASGSGPAPGPGAAPAPGRLTSQLRMQLDPKAEFRQIFNEGWRNQRDYLYVKNMQGADWPAVRQMYEPMLAHVMHRADLNYLLDQMGAEIAIGHSYVRGGDMPEVPQSLVGLLGADFAVENGRYRITRIYDAESWNPSCGRRSRCRA